MDRLRCFDTPVKRLGVAWTVDDVSARFFEAAITAKRLPPVRVQGYFNTWPAFARSEWEAYSVDEPVRRSFPPSPEEVDRMLETMQWVLWLEVERLAAIVDFTFNLGAGRLQTSTLRRRINQQDWPSAGQELRRWIYGGGRVLAGLRVRRQAEVDLLVR